MASLKTTLNGQGYLDNSGCRPATRRTWLNDTGHLSAVTGLSCRGRPPAVCPVLAGRCLGSGGQGLDELGCWEACPQLQPSPARRVKAAQGKIGAEAGGLGRPSPTPTPGIPQPGIPPQSRGAESIRRWKAKDPGLNLQLPSSVTLGSHRHLETQRKEPV